MTPTERAAAWHATKRVIMLIGGTIIGVGGVSYGAMWLSLHYGPGSVLIAVGAAFGVFSIVMMWRAIYSYAKRQIENGTPRKDWWF